MNNPLISVLMPAYNAESYIAEAIESLINQTYNNWELLICDDASTDNTFEIATSFKDKRILVFKNSKNIKKPRTINFLFPKSKGDLITIHDADDISNPKRFELQLNFLLNKNCDFCGCDLEYINKNGTNTGVYIEKKKYYDSQFPRYGDATLIIKRECLENIEIFRQYFENNMDYDLGLRLLDKYSYKNLDFPLYYYRNVINSVSKDYTSIKKIINTDMARFFAKQRKEVGYDYLMVNQSQNIKLKEKELMNFYIKNKGILEASASIFLSEIKMYSYSFKYSIIALTKNPLKFNYYKILLANLNKYVREIFTFN